MKSSAERFPVGVGGTRRFRFGPFTLDLDDASLRRGEERLELRRKSFDVLAALVVGSGRLMTREHLLEEVWPDATIDERGLSVCIKEVRAVLGDDPRAPSYVETAHRRGYRFIAPVEAVGDASTQTVTHEERAHVHAPRSIRFVWSQGAPVSFDAPLVDGVRDVGRGSLGGWTLDDAAVSRRHARVSFIGGRWRVEDCGSKNGSFVDGVPLKGTSTDAREGAIVRLGETILLLGDERAKAVSVLTALTRGARTSPRASAVERALLASFRSP